MEEAGDMADFMTALKNGRRRELYQGVLEDIVTTLADGCSAYTKPGTMNVSMERGAPPAVGCR